MKKKLQNRLNVVVLTFWTIPTFISSHDKVETNLFSARQHSQQSKPCYRCQLTAKFCVVINNLPTWHSFNNFCHFLLMIFWTFFASIENVLLFQFFLYTNIVIISLIRSTNEIYFFSRFRHFNRITFLRDYHTTCWKTPLRLKSITIWWNLRWVHIRNAYSNW